MQGDVGSRVGRVIGFCSLALASVSAADAGLGDELEAALSGSGLVHTRTGRDTYLVVFDAERAADVAAWAVTVRAVHDEWVLIFATMIDGEPSRLFSPAFLRRALTYNAMTAGAKLALDAEHGDLDAQYEIPRAALGPEVLRLVANDVAATCDAHYGEFRALADER